MSRLTILSKRQKFQAQGSSGRFVKDVLHEGEWIHPLTGKKLVFDHDRLERLAANTTRYLDAGSKVPFPDGHTTSALANLGEWPGPAMTYGKDLLFVVEPKDKVALQKIRDGALDAVSVCIDFDYMDSKGNKYDEVITHVAATDYPVITDQKEFVELSADQVKAELYVPAELATKFKNNPTPGEGDPISRRTAMDLSKLRSLLGLPKELADEKVVEEAEKKLGKLNEEKTEAAKAVEAQLASQLAEHGMTLSAGKVLKLDRKPTTELEKEQAERLSALELEGAKAKIASAKVLAEGLVKAGKVPSAMMTRVQKLLACTGKFEALSLGTDPKTVCREAIDLTSELSALFAAVPGLTQEGLKQLRKEQLSTEQKETEELSKTVSEIAARVQGPVAAAK